MRIITSIVLIALLANSSHAFESCLGNDIKQASNALDDLKRTFFCKNESDFKSCSENFGIESQFSREASIEGAKLALLAGIKKRKGLTCPLPTKGVYLRFFPKAEAETPTDLLCSMPPKDRAAVVEKEMRDLLKQYQEALDIEKARYQKLSPSARGAVLSQHMENMLDDVEIQFEKELKDIESGKLSVKDAKLVPRETTWGGTTNRVSKAKVNELRENIRMARQSLRTLPADQIEDFINKELSLNNKTQSSNFLRAFDNLSGQNYLKIFKSHWNDAQPDLVDFSHLDSTTENVDRRKLSAYAKKYPRFAEVADLVDHKIQMQNASDEIRETLADLDKPVSIKTDEDAIARMKTVVSKYDGIFDDLTRPVYEPRDPTLFNKIHVGTKNLFNTVAKGMQTDTPAKSALVRRARNIALKSTESIALKRGKSILIKSATGFGTVLTVVDVASAASDIKDVVETVTMDDDGSCLKDEPLACQKLLKGIQNNKCEAVPVIELAEEFFFKSKEQQLNDIQSCKKFCEQFIKPMVGQIGSRKWDATCNNKGDSFSGFTLKSKNASEKESITVNYAPNGKIQTASFVKKNPHSDRLTLYSSLIEYDEYGRKPIYSEIQDKNKFYKASTPEQLQFQLFQNDNYIQKENWFTFDQVQKCCAKDSIMDPKDCYSYGINRTPTSGPKSRSAK